MSVHTHLYEDLFARAAAQTAAGDAEYPEGIPPKVCDLFDKIALRLAKGAPEAGIKPRERFSADAVLHQIRWQFQVEHDNREFKCNDHWTAPLARWFLEKHPELKGFFELREKHKQRTSA